MKKPLLPLAFILCFLAGCGTAPAPTSDDTGWKGQQDPSRDSATWQTDVAPPPTMTPCPTCVPCPPSPTPTAIPSIGSRAKPIPFGDTLLTFVDTNKLFSVTLLESYRGEEAWNRLLEANQYNEPAREDMEYLLLYTQVGYLTGPQTEALQLDQGDFRIVSQNQILRPPSLVEPEPAFEIEYFPDASGGGWMAWAIYKDDEAPLLVLGLKRDGSGGMYLATTP